MRRHRIHNTIAESGFTLPVFGIAGIALWHPWTWDNPFDTLPLLLHLLSCYALMEFCNRWQLIRVRSRITTSLFAFGTGCMAFHDMNGLLPMGITLAVAVVLISLACCYEKREPVIHAFHVAFCVGIMSVFCPSLCVIGIVALFCMAVFLRVFSIRVLSASLVGFVLPWLLYAVWLAAPLVLDYLGTGIKPSIDMPWQLASPLFVVPGMQDLASIPFKVGAVWAGTTLVGLVALLHFLAFSYDDKIRTRVLFYVIICFWLSIQGIMVLRFGLVQMLLPALWYLTCPLAAHHFALSPSRWTTFWFFIVISAWVFFIFIDKLP